MPKGKLIVRSQPGARVAIVMVDMSPRHVPASLSVCIRISR